MLLSGEDRLAMCRLAAKDHARFSVSDIELRREGKSFTFDTVCELRQLYPDDKLYLIVGSDMFLSIDSWYRAQELMHMITICAAAREKGEYDQLIEKQLVLDTQGVKSVICEIDELPVSSTDIRRRLREGLSVEGMLPSRVLDYIKAHRLYES